MVADITQFAHHSGADLTLNSEAPLLGVRGMEVRSDDCLVAQARINTGWKYRGQGTLNIATHPTGRQTIRTGEACNRVYSWRGAGDVGEQIVELRLVGDTEAPADNGTILSKYSSTRCPGEADDGRDIIRVSGNLGNGTQCERKARVPQRCSRIGFSGDRQVVKNIDRLVSYFVTSTKSQCQSVSCSPIVLEVERSLIFNEINFWGTNRNRYRGRRPVDETLEVRVRVGAVGVGKESVRLSLTAVLSTKLEQVAT